MINRYELKNSSLKCGTMTKRWKHKCCWNEVDIKASALFFFNRTNKIGTY